MFLRRLLAIQVKAKPQILLFVSSQMFEALCVQDLFQYCTIFCQTDHSPLAFIFLRQAIHVFSGIVQQCNFDDLKLKNPLMPNNADDFRVTFKKKTRSYYIAKVNFIKM